jgi:hypothetical protein
MIKKNIATNELGFVFNPATGDSFSTNPVAATILRYMREGRSLAEIKKLILEDYDADASTVEKDLDDFVHTLKEFNLLAPSAN